MLVQWLHMKSQVMKSRNLPKEAKAYEKIVNVKPIGLLIATLLTGALIALLKPYLAVTGISMVVLSLFCLIVMPDKDLCRFTKDYIVLYNRHDKSECTILYWDEILSWHYEWYKTYDLLVIEMIDGTQYTQEMYSIYAIKKMMEIHAPSKMKKNIRYRKDV